MIFWESVNNFLGLQIFNRHRVFFRHTTVWVLAFSSTFPAISIFRIREEVSIADTAHSWPIVLFFFTVHAVSHLVLYCLFVLALALTCFPFKHLAIWTDDAPLLVLDSPALAQTLFLLHIVVPVDPTFPANSLNSIESICTLAFGVSIVFYHLFFV